MGSRFSLAATIFGSFLVRAGGAATGVILGLILSHLHRAGVRQDSALAISLLVAAFNASELVGAPLAGLLIDRRGARTLLIAGPAVGVVAAAIMVTPLHLISFTGARLIQGLTTACTVPAALAYLSEMSGKDASARGRIMGLFEVGSIGGLAVGYVAGGFLWDFVHRQAFLYLVALYWVAAGVLALTGGGGGKPRTQKSVATIWHAAKHAADLVPSWLALNAAAGIWFGQAAYQLSGAHPRPHQLLSVGLSGTTIGLIFGIYTLLFAVGTVGWGWMVGRVSAGTALKIGTYGVIVMAVSLIGVNHAGSFGSFMFRAALGIGIVALAAETAFSPAALTLLAARSDSVPERRGAVMGVYSTLLAGGQLLGAALGGVFAVYWGIDGLGFATIGLGLLALATLPRNMAPRSSAAAPALDWHASQNPTN